MESSISDYTIDQDELKSAYIDLIKTTRNIKGLSIRQLSELSGVSHTAIYDLESNTKFPKFEILNKLANALDFDIDIKRYTSPKEKLPVLILCYAPRGQVGVATRQANIYPRYRAYKTSLDDILIKKGLHTDDINEIKEFIEFKLSKLNKKKV